MNRILSASDGGESGPAKVMFALFGGRRGRVVAALLFMVTITMLLFQNNRPMRATPINYTQNQNSSLLLFDSNDYDRKVHLLIPVTSPNQLYCKVLFSALVNAYPPPQLINYNEQFADPQIARAMKIKGFRNYLKNKTGDKDIVILVDGFDAWFQLPLPIMVSRFLKLGTSVIFGADKKCWPNDPTSPACTLPPESPLPSDIYGPDTDRQTIMRDNRPKFENFRPRWVNSGTIIGYARELREIYEAAWKKIEGHGEVNSDQMIVAEVYAERLQAGKKDMLADFHSNLFQTMTFSHNDITFIRTPSTLLRATTFGAKPSTRRLDLDGLGIPEAGSAVITNGGAVSPWTYRNLAWNRFTNTIPTLLHFNGPKEFLENWWPLMWWSDNGRAIHAELTSEKNKQRAGSRVGDGWLSWEATCGQHDLFPFLPKQE